MVPPKKLVGVVEILPIDNIVVICEVDKEHVSIPRAARDVLDVKSCLIEEPISKARKRTVM
jgi:hypothetical protein